MRKYRIDYDINKNCYKDIDEVESDLLFGDKGYVSEPFITYVIPTYKRADLLIKTLGSINNQEEVNEKWDIIVVDNESGFENETEKVIKSINNPRILYYRNRENIGVAGNYNRCIQLARGKWIAMIHADDLIMNDHLKISIKQIKEASKTGKLAYISQRYVDFDNESKIRITRTKENEKKDLVDKFLCHEYTNGQLLKMNQKYGMMTGYFTSLPSFGTIMNKNIMIECGGFNESLGICEDIIIPYKLSKKYDVYMSPIIMGFHRFDDNETMKKSTILEIYKSMLDFREYMYSKNDFWAIWRFISKDILAENLMNYCIGISEYSNEKVSKVELEKIYKLGRISNIKRFFFNLIKYIYCKKNNIDTYGDSIRQLMEIDHDVIIEAVNDGKKFVIYGAGAVTKELVPLLKKNYKGINIDAIVVSQEKKQNKMRGIPVYLVDQYNFDNEKSVVITSTIIERYRNDMLSILKKKNITNVINLIHM